ncbi:hypothetical protein NQ317_003435 [Molorchus minor]|uniref:Uncharacterized protein n=1 Tax=Molorchus minor TaxID=1323400 RepID=A0ABQ9J1Q3_9CUCU|nr:hypothetical protein NQ317_003435 [Molorchus minor]
MATSSSDESNMAPKDFQLSTSSSDSGSQYSPNKHKCPLCQKFKNCIRNGLFYSSKPSSSEQFLDKQKVFLELQYTTKDS